MEDQAKLQANAGKFLDPVITATGEPRATVALSDPQTLWFNTGTLCNIECVNCYILSSPTNDALVYLSADEVSGYLDQLEDRNWGVREIGFTGGEPYMNPEFNQMCRLALERGYEVLVLTNAMQPMMRESVKTGIAALVREFGDRMTFRISLDHWTKENHDRMRGAGSFDKTIAGMRWLSSLGAHLAVAGRQIWNEDEVAARVGFNELFSEEEFKIDAQDPGMTVLFPEMDTTVEVPEITAGCWDILGKSPKDVMCATSRMVVKHKGKAPSVAACTLLPYDPEFDLGATLEEAESDVALTHPHCAKFCVLGGASCSA